MQQIKQPTSFATPAQPTMPFRTEYDTKLRGRKLKAPTTAPTDEEIKFHKKHVTPAVVKYFEAHPGTM
jgi:hypothetical protein